MPARSARHARGAPVRDSGNATGDGAGSGAQARPQARSRGAEDQATGGAWPRCWRRPGASAQGMSGAASGQCGRTPALAGARGNRSSSLRSHWLASRLVGRLGRRADTAAQLGRCVFFHRHFTAAAFHRLLPGLRGGISRVVRQQRQGAQQQRQHRHPRQQAGQRRAMTAHGGTELHEAKRARAERATQGRQPLGVRRTIRRQRGVIVMRAVSGCK